MYLEKEDVSIYYEVRGRGTPLILIHGVIVDADLYTKAAELLARYYQVITYDRRGNSRSTFKTTQKTTEENAPRPFEMEDQVQDLLALMDALHIDDAFIVGQSAGAMIGQYFLQEYPEKVRHLIMYEPAIMGFLDDMPNVHEWTTQMKELIGKQKFNSALLQFAQKISPSDTRSPRKSIEETYREMGNHQYALTQEFPELVSYHPDIKKTKKHKDRITLAMGEKSDDPVYMNGLARFANALETDILFYPGFHNLPFDLPREFAINVLGTLMLFGE